MEVKGMQIEAGSFHSTTERRGFVSDGKGITSRKRMYSILASALSVEYTDAQSLSLPSSLRAGVERRKPQVDWNDPEMNRNEPPVAERRGS